MKITVHYPTNEEASADLARHVSEAHADAVLRYIENLPCPKAQKLALLDAVISRASAKSAASG